MGKQRAGKRRDHADWSLVPDPVGIQCRRKIRLHRGLAVQPFDRGPIDLAGLRVGRDQRLDPFLDELSKRSEEHTSELQSLMRISYAVFCLKKKTQRPKQQYSNSPHPSDVKNTHQNSPDTY